MSHFITIAIDGPAASGKGTIARRIAYQFHLSHLDTGALYRAVAKKILDQGQSPDDPVAAANAATYIRDNLSWELLEDEGLRSDVVADAASRTSKIPKVREILLDTQRLYALRPPHKPGLKPWSGSILDGRDIGTVVCPNADVKFFVTASAEIRAERRTKELLARGVPADYKTVLEEMKSRDLRDSTRETAPAKPANDAVILDTTTMTADEAFEKACAVIREKLA